MRVGLVVALLALGAPVAASAQQGPAKLARVFSGVFGPNGLVVNSEAVLPDGSTHSAHFNSAFQSNFAQFNIALASQLTALPLPSPASGFTYAFDTATGTFKRTTQSFGPILSDRAETIGRGRFSFGYNYQYFSFDRLETLDLSRVEAVFTHDDHQLGGGRSDVVTTVNTIEASVGQLTGALTYGLTDRVDLALAVPVVRTSLNVTSLATVRRLGTAASPTIHFFRDADASGGIGSQRNFVAGGAASGIGDLIVRAKGTVLREGHRGLALGVDVRLPTGDELDLIGSGATGVKPFGAFSISYGRISPHANVGYQWNGSSVLAGDPDSGVKGDLPDQFLYAVGADIGVSGTFTLVADVLGHHTIDSPRLRTDILTVTTPDGSAGFPDLEFVEESFSAVSGALGFKANVAGRLLVNFNLRFRLSDGGLTDRVTPLVGIEYGF